MKRTFYLIMALLTLSMASVRAQEIEIPDDAPRETWQLVYDDYRSLYWKSAPEYKNLAMDVTVVRGENCLYVQGIAKSCPDSWIKIGETDDFLNNDLLMWSNQPITVDGSIQFLNAGALELCYWDPTHYAAQFNIEFWGSKNPIIFKRELTSNLIEYKADLNSAFWVRDKPDTKISYSYTRFFDNPEPPTDSDFPDDEIYMNPRLIDKAGGPTAGINTPDDGEADAPVYTLSGIRVDRDNLAPGIYVSQGRKIMVK